MSTRHDLPLAGFVVFTVIIDVRPSCVDSKGSDLDLLEPKHVDSVEILSPRQFADAVISRKKEPSL